MLAISGVKTALGDQRPYSRQGNAFPDQRKGLLDSYCGVLGWLSHFGADLADSLAHSHSPVRVEVHERVEHLGKFVRWKLSRVKISAVNAPRATHIS